jgi:hypothetical protein
MGGEDDNMTTAMHEDLLPSVKDWLCLLLATPVQFSVGRRFYQYAYWGLVHGRTMGMDFLVAMGTSSAYLYSAIVFVLRIVAADRDNVDVDRKANALFLDRRLANHVRHAGEVPRGVRKGGDRWRAVHAYEVATRIGDARRASPGVVVELNRIDRTTMTEGGATPDVALALLSSSLLSKIDLNSVPMEERDITEVSVGGGRFDLNRYYL